MNASVNSHKFTNNNEIQPYICVCPECGNENEIFMGEFKNRQICVSCGCKIEFLKCAIY